MKNIVGSISRIGSLLLASSMLLLIAVMALQSPNKISGMAITSSQNTAGQYCNADWSCYGPLHKGFRKADCSWMSVEACGINSTCPQESVLAESCVKKCVGDGKCEGCNATCVSATPTPAPKPVVFNEICGKTTPTECENEEIYNQRIVIVENGFATNCKKTTETGWNLLSCPKCPNGKLDNCVNVFWGVVWKAKCVEEEKNACGAAISCPTGFLPSEEACEKQFVSVEQCCKKQA